MPGLAAPPKKETDPLVWNESYEASNFAFEAISADEAKKGSKRLGRMTYEFRMADTVNRNRRIYPSEVVKVAVNEMQDRISKNRVMGRLDHPDPWEMSALMVTLSEAVVKIVSVEMASDTDIKVVADVLNNEYGRQLVSIIEAGGNPGISQRATASWRDATDEERAQYQIPEDAYIVVAETLRLITYDIVSEPGFGDADQPTVTEAKGAVMDLSNLTLETLKAGRPDIVRTIMASGAAEAKSEVEKQIAEAVEAKRPEIVAEAEKAAKVKVEEANAKRDKAIEALKAVKPALEALGIVNEKITDAEAAAKNATLEAQVKTLESTIAEKDKVIAAHEAKSTAAEAESNRFKGVKAVSEAYREHPQHDLIIKTVDEDKSWKTPEDGMECAKRIALIVEAASGHKAAPEPSSQPMWRQFAKSEGPASGGAGSETKNPQQQAVEALMGSRLNNGLSL